MNKIYSSVYLLFFIFFSINATAQYTRWSSNLDSALTNITFSPATNNLWQVGSTTKTFFGAANSLPNAIMTDTMNAYPVNANSSFIISFNVYSPYTNHFYDNYIWLDFDHKYQATSGHDGGSIEVSYDQINWQNVLLDTLYSNNAVCVIDSAPAVNNFYARTDTLFNGQPGFTGQSSGWVHSQIHWCWFLELEPESQQTFPPDSMWVRFTFYSDSIADSLDGWMIDNMVLRGDNPSAINEINSLNKYLNIYPQPANEFIKFDLSNNDESDSYSICDITGRIIQKGKAGNNIIDTHQLNAGNYLLQVNGKTNKQYRKTFLKE